MTGDWRDKRVLVTGARGFIAAHLCDRLAAAGARVHGVSATAARPPHQGMEWSRADVTNRAVVTDLVRRAAPDVVFHLAGHVTGVQDVMKVEPTFTGNLASTVYLLEACTQHGRPRVVLAGSMQEPEGDEATEVPCSPYAASKWACTGDGRMFHALYGLPVVIARPMMAYGPGQWDVGKLLPHLALSLLQGKPPAISSGTRELDWVFVDDVAAGLMAVGLAPGIEGKSLDLGSGTLTSIRTIVEHVRALTGSEMPVPFGAVPDRPLERPRAARVEETRRLTGWSAETSLADGLARTIDWYRERCSSLKPA